MTILTSLLCVFFGFLLGQFGTLWFEYLKGRQAKHLIREEVKSNLALLPQKEEVVKNLQRSFAQKRILPGDSVPFMTTAYDLNIHLAYSHLKPFERDSLHVLFERAKQIDIYVAKVEAEILKHLELKLVKDPYALFESRMKELLESLKIIKDLGNKYLEGNPVNVFFRPKK